MVMKAFFALEEMRFADNGVNIGLLSPEAEIATSRLAVQEASSDVEKLSGQIDEASQTVYSLGAINEAIERTIPNGGLSEPVAQALTAAVEHFMKRMGAPQKVIPAMEAFSGTVTRKRATVLAVEGIGSVIDSAWEYIKAAFKKLGDFFRSLFDKLFSSQDAQKRKAAKLKESLKEAKRKFGDPSTKEEDVVSATGAKPFDNLEEFDKWMTSKDNSDFLSKIHEPVKPSSSSDKVPDKEDAPVEAKPGEPFSAFLSRRFLCVANTRLAQYLDPAGSTSFRDIGANYIKAMHNIDECVSEVGKLIADSRSKIKDGDASDSSEHYLHLLMDYDLGGKPASGTAVTYTKRTTLPFRGEILWSKDKSKSREEKLNIEWRARAFTDEGLKMLIQCCSIALAMEVNDVTLKTFNNEAIAKLIKQTLDADRQLIGDVEKKLKGNSDKIADIERGSDEDKAEKIKELKAENDSSFDRLNTYKAEIATWLKLLGYLAQYQTTTTSVIMDWVDVSMTEISRRFAHVNALKEAVKA